MDWKAKGNFELPIESVTHKLTSIPHPILGTIPPNSGQPGYFAMLRGSSVGFTYLIDQGPVVLI
jgi:hypothetical protein